MLDKLPPARKFFIEASFVWKRWPEIVSRNNWLIILQRSNISNNHSLLREESGPKLFYWEFSVILHYLSSLFGIEPEPVKYSIITLIWAVWAVWPVFPLGAVPILGTSLQLVTEGRQQPELRNERGRQGETGRGPYLLKGWRTINILTEPESASTSETLLADIRGETSLACWLACLNKIIPA